MVIIVLDDIIIIESMLKNIDKRAEVILLLEELLNLKFNDYKFNSIEKLNSVIEYNFSLVQVRVTLQTGEQKQIFIKLIQGGMIKESIFCYSSLLYEKYTNCNRYNLPQKVTIKEKVIQKNRKNIVLTIDKEQNYCTEIYLIEIKKFLEMKTKENSNYKDLMEYFKSNDKDILFLGII